MRASGPAPLRLLAGSFLGLIAVGSTLLLLPAATPPDRPISVVDAVFTATSATCVTGLIVRDTGTEFTLFGQAVILALIQLGGLGIMTFSLLIFSFLGARLSLAYRTVLEQTLAGAGLWEDLWPLLRMVFRFTLVTEALGALILFARWHDSLGVQKAAYSAVFHAISAFCNAGFSLRSDSLMAYRADALTNLTMGGLIILGGLGFLTVYDLQHGQRKGPRRLSLHSKLTLAMSGGLIAVGTALIWLLELHNSLAGTGRSEQFLASFFQSVTARTAGFNTLDVAGLAPATLFLLIILMFVGGSPGSCAGGIKTTTFGVFLLVSWNRLRHRRHVSAFGRTLPRGTVQNALSVAVSGTLLTVAGLFLLLVLETPRHAAGPVEPAAFVGYLFETVSALGTVGLSTGITRQLEPASRILVTLLMFIGRLGPLTLAAAVSRESSPPDDWSYPEESVMVG